MPRNGITTNTPANIPFGAGVYFAGVAYSEAAVPTPEQIRAGIIGATQDGGTLTITPEFFAPELDGATVAVKELQQKIGETAQMDVTFAELTPKLVEKMVIGQSKIVAASNKDNPNMNASFTAITSSKLVAGHFYDGFGYYGKYIDGRPLIIMFKQALCTSGMSTDAKNKTNSVFKGTFVCHSDIEYGVDKLPYVIFICTEGTWELTDANALSA